MAIVNLPTMGGFFKPEDAQNYAAMLVEPTSLERQRPGSFGPKDAIHADVTVFATQADLEAGVPSGVNPGMIIQGIALVRDLESVIGSGVVVECNQAKTHKPGQKPAWIWSSISPLASLQVADYAAKRDEATAAALADAPSWLK